MADRLIRLRYPAHCRECGRALAVGTSAWWEPDSRQMRCAACESGEQNEGIRASAIERGVPGGSAQREYERRRKRREDKIVCHHPRIGRLIVAATDEPPSTKAWAQGAHGERQLGAYLDARLGDDAVVLHDRRLPRSRANIDHIVIAASGVWVIDTKKYKGRVERRDVGGIFRRDEQLFVAGRDGSPLVESVNKQTEAVCAAVGAAAVPNAVVVGVLCFVDANWPTFARPFAVGRVEVTWPKALTKRIKTAATKGVDVERVAVTIAGCLPPST